MSFFTDFEELFKVVFNYWLHFNLSHDRLEDSATVIRQEILTLPPYIPGTYNTSHCSMVQGMEEIMVRRLREVSGGQ